MNEATEQPSKKPVYKLFTLGLVILTIGIIGLLFSRLPDTQVLGYIHDDGIYAITAKALAQGKGYSLIHLLGQPPQTKYPIIYPLILSVGWLINPHFPDNLLLLSNMTLFFSLAALAVMFYYFKVGRGWPTWLAWLSILLVCSNLVFMGYSTSLMSEGPYLLFSLITVFYAERRLQNPTIKYLLITALLSALCFHTRILGLMLIIAIGFWLLLQKQIKAAVIYGVTSLSLSVGVWQLWIFSNRAIQLPPLMKAYTNYSSVLLSHFQGETSGDSFMSAMSDLWTNMGTLLFPVLYNLPYLVKNGHLFKEPVYILGILLLTFGLLGYFLVQLVAACRRRQFSIPAIYIVLYLFFISLWGFSSQLPRFLIVLSPFLWLYMLTPLLTWLKPTVSNARWIVLTVFLLGIGTLINVVPYYHWTYLTRQRHSIDDGRYTAIWSDFMLTAQYIREHLPKDATIACTWDTIVYIYTNRLTYYLKMTDRTTKDLKQVKQFVESAYQDMDHQGVHYLLGEPNIVEHKLVSNINFIPLGMLLLHRSEIKPVYTSPHNLFVLFKVQPVRKQKA